MLHPELWIPAGNWAEWAGSALAGGSLIGLVIGLRGERTARRQDLAEAMLERRRTQARLVSAWVESTSEHEGREWRLHVVNRSDLAIRTAVGYLYRPDRRPLGAFQLIPIISPGLPDPESTGLDLDAPVKAVSLVLVFTDDAGIRWRKYHHADPEGLTEILPGQRDLDDWLGFAPLS